MNQPEHVERNRIAGAILVLLALVGAAAGADKPRTPEQEQRLQQAKQLGDQARQQYLQGNLAESIATLEKRRVIELDILGLDHPDTLGTTEALTKLHTDREEFARARALCQEVLALQLKKHPESHYLVIEVRRILKEIDKLEKLEPEGRKKLRASDERLNQAVILLQQAKADQALPLLRQEVEEREKLLGDKDLDLAHALTQLGHCQAKLNDWPAALATYRRARALYQEALGEEYPTGVELVFNQAQVLGAQGHVAEARAYLEKGCELLRKCYGPDNPVTAQAIAQLGLFLRNEGDNKGALPLLEQAVALQKKALGESHAETARTMILLGMVQFRLGDVPSARKNFEQALAILIKRVGVGHRELAGAMLPLGELFLQQGDYLQAGQALSTAVHTWRSTLGSNHTDTAAAVLLMGDWRRAQGDYAEALLCYEEALGVFRRTLDKNNLQVANTLTRLGQWLSETGSWDQARRCFENADAIYRATGRQIHPDALANRGQLAVVFQLQGDFASAKKCLDEILAVRRQDLPASHPDLAVSYLDLGHLEMTRDRPEEALSWYEQAVALRRRVLGEEDARTLEALALQGLALQLHGQRDEARAVYEQVLAGRKKVLGKQHPHTARTLLNLGCCLQEQGQLAEAKTLHEQALAALRQTLAPEHSGVAQALLCLGWVQLENKEPVQAADSLAEALAIWKKRLAEAHTVLAPGEAVTIARMVLATRDLLLEAYRQQKDIPPERAYQAVWDSGVLIHRLALEPRSMRSRRREADQLWEQIQMRRAELTHWNVRVTIPPDAAQRDRLVLLTGEKVELEKRLADLDTDFVRSWRAGQASVTDLTDQLPAGTALLELVAVETGVARTPAGMRRYQAFLVAQDGSKGRVKIQAFDLGPAAAIEEAARSWRLLLRTEKLPAEVEPAPDQRLRRLVWEPIQDRLQAYSRLVVVTDAALAGTPWAALPGESPGSYLVEKLAVGVIGDPLELYDVLARRPTPRDGILIVGGGDPEADSRQPLPLGSLSAWRSLTGWHRDKGRPAGAEEVDLVLGIAGRSSAVDVLQGGGASVHRVGELMTRCGWVHLAAPCAASGQAAWLGDYKRGRTLGMTELPQPKVAALRGGRPPLLLGGVVLAGAMKPGQPDSTEGRRPADDGILSGDEIAELDLTGTNLVVLGDADPNQAGEETPALQRAFHRAGARAVLGSLWPGDAAVRHNLLKRFYDNMRQQKMPPLEALRQAQISLLRDPKTSSVQAWAGWALSGHPGLFYPLPGVAADATEMPPESMWRRHGPLLAAGVLVVMLGVAGWFWRRGGRSGKD